MSSYRPPCADEPAWRDDRFNHSCEYYAYMDKSQDWTSQELSQVCSSDVSAGLVPAYQACLLSCKSKKCSHDCYDSKMWRSKDHGLPCNAYAAPQLNHNFCGVDHDREGTSAQNACPFSCKTCTSGLANLDDPPFLPTVLLTLLVIAPLFIRVLEVLGAVQEAVLRRGEPGCCCCCPAPVRGWCNLLCCAPPDTDNRSARPATAVDGGWASDSGSSLPSPSKLSSTPQPAGHALGMSMEVHPYGDNFIDEEEMEFMASSIVEEENESLEEEEEEQEQKWEQDGSATAALHQSRGQQEPLPPPPHTLGVDVVWARHTAYYHFAFDHTVSGWGAQQGEGGSGWGAPPSVVGCDWLRLGAVVSRRSRLRCVSCSSFYNRSENGLAEVVSQRLWF
jgi:hypothetical protein